jgi:predicted phosphodiesterase
MGNIITKITIILSISFSLSACERYEFRGFVFSYQSADERFEQSMIWNKNHPFQEINVPGESYTIFCMSDSHVGSTENLDYFLYEAKKGNATAAIMAGDLTDGHQEDFERFYQHLPHQDTLRTFQVSGNHDLYFNAWQHFYQYFGSTTYYFTIQTPTSSDLFICLDTGSGTLGNKQLEWFKKTLTEERPKHRNAFIVTHNNLFRIRHASSTNPYVEEIRVLIELCVKHRVDMVITGHDHKSSVVQHGNTTHITMDALTDSYSDPSFFVLRVDDGGIEFEFRDV